MQVFVEEFVKTIPNKAIKAIIVMDQEGRHKDLQVPTNIELVYLPPYSPELNPLERLWQHIKGIVLKNQVYNTLDVLEERLVDCLGAISRDTIMSVCKCSYI